MYGLGWSGVRSAADGLRYASARRARENQAMAGSTRQARAHRGRHRPQAGLGARLRPTWRRSGSIRARRSYLSRLNARVCSLDERVGAGWYWDDSKFCSTPPRTRLRCDRQVSTAATSRTMFSTQDLRVVLGARGQYVLVRALEQAVGSRKAASRPVHRTRSPRHTKIVGGRRSR